MQSTKIILVGVVIVIVGFLMIIMSPDDTKPQNNAKPDVTSFEECVAAGNPVMESYPRQCRHGDTLFVEEIEPTQPEPQHDLIILDAPQPNDAIASPIAITGQARGNWFFEANFPVVLTDWNGLIIAEGYATALDDWMTTDFVPFRATLEFEKPTLYNNGSLILQKANASGLPEHDDALEITILFK